MKNRWATTAATTTAAPGAVRPTDFDHTHDYDFWRTF